MKAVLLQLIQTAVTGAGAGKTRGEIARTDARESKCRFAQGLAGHGASVRTGPTEVSEPIDEYDSGPRDAAVVAPTIPAGPAPITARS